MNLSKLLHVFVKVVVCICQSCCMYLSKLLHVFVKVVTCIFQSCHMYLSKLLHVFVIVVTCICYYKYFSPCSKPNQSKVWPRFQTGFMLCFFVWICMYFLKLVFRENYGCSSHHVLAEACCHLCCRCFALLPLFPTTQCQRKVRSRLWCLSTYISSEIVFTKNSANYQAWGQSAELHIFKALQRGCDRAEPGWDVHVRVQSHPLLRTDHGKVTTISSEHDTLLMNT